MKLSDILQSKGTQVFTIAPQASMADATAAMLENNCGSLVVCDGGQVVGIITERDVLRACADDSRPLVDVPVKELMTCDVVTCSKSDKISDVMGWMTEMRIRHLPVLDDGRLAGIVSIGDVVKAEHSLLSVENQYLKHYIQS
jgi:CBS domain-containing protein